MGTLSQSPSPDGGCPSTQSPETSSTPPPYSPTAQSPSSQPVGSPATPNAATLTRPEQNEGPPPTPATPPRASRIPINQITVNDPTNSRAAIDDAAVDALAKNIAAIGLINPITVRATTTGYELIAGLNRLLACKRLNSQHIDATVLHADDLTCSTVRLAENTVRSNLTPIEEAHSLALLVEKHPEAVDGVAAMLGRTVDWVLDRLDILKYPDELQRCVHQKTVSLAAAKWLARIPDPDEQASLIHQAEQNGITAATARLWYQHAVQQKPESLSVSENEDREHITPLKTTTTTPCNLCTNDVDLNDARTLYFCPQCVSAIADARRQNALTRPIEQESQSPHAP